MGCIGNMDIWAILVSIGVPTALTSFWFWLLKRKISKTEQEQSKREEARKKNELLTIKSINAAIALSEATALAIKNGHSNGETEAALQYAREIKHEQKNFLAEQGITNLYGKN